MSIRSRRTREETYQAYANRPKRVGASSQHRGVSFRKQTQLWIAQVYWRGRRYFLGSFKTEREAPLAYNIYAQRIIGEMALLNDLSTDDTDEHGPASSAEQESAEQDHQGLGEGAAQPLEATLNTK